MRIVDRRKDYYDGVQGMGQDMSLSFIRSPKVERFDPENGTKTGLKPWCFPRLGPSYHASYRYGRNYTIGIQDNVVGFCGKVYPALRLWNPEHPDKCVWVHSLEAFDQAVQDLDFDEQLVETYMESRHVNYTRQWQRRLSSVGGSFPYRKHVAKLYFGVEDGNEGFMKHRDRHEKLFIENLTPVFVATYQPGWGSDGHRIEYNALLRPVEFFRVFDPYRAYQEISMYMGNMAFPNRPIPHISDEVMAEAKGFDKFSFRKDKSKPKK